MKEQFGTLARKRLVKKSTPRADLDSCKYLHRKPCAVSITCRVPDAFLPDHNWQHNAIDDDGTQDHAPVDEHRALQKTKKIIP